MSFLPFPTLAPSAPSRAARLAAPADLSFLLHCQRRWAEQVGFLPTSTFKRYIAQGQIAICEENGFPAGYVNWCGTTKSLTRILQVAVEPDLLREGVGSQLMALVEQFARSHKQSMMRLTSRVDLFANSFWPTLGFTPSAFYQRTTTRGLPLVEWSKCLLAISADSPLSRYCTSQLHPRP